jgi:hypothetical protein
MATTSDMLRDVAHHHGWRWQSVKSNAYNVHIDYFNKNSVTVTVHYDNLGRTAIADWTARREDGFKHLAKKDPNKTEQVVEWLTAA